MSDSREKQEWMKEGHKPTALYPRPEQDTHPQALSFISAAQVTLTASLEPGLLISMVISMVQTSRVDRWFREKKVSESHTVSGRKIMQSGGSLDPVNGLTPFIANCLDVRKVRW